MTPIGTRPVLRLVNDRVAPTPRTGPGRDASPRRRNGTAAREVARENRTAAGIGEIDPRWALAVRVARELEGGRAAVLPPERRRTLVALGMRLGLRPFDSNLVIAVVQDAVRSGAGAFSPETALRLDLVGRAGLGEAKGRACDPGTGEFWVCGIAAVLLAGMAAFALASWIVG